MVDDRKMGMRGVGVGKVVSGGERGCREVD